MFKQKLSLEVKGKDERVYELHLNQASPLGEVWDALNVMRGEVFRLMKEHEEKEKPQEEAPCEPECEEEVAE